MMASDIIATIIMCSMTYRKPEIIIIIKNAILCILNVKHFLFLEKGILLHEWITLDEY